MSKITGIWGELTGLDYNLKAASYSVAVAIPSTVHDRVALDQLLLPGNFQQDQRLVKHQCHFRAMAIMSLLPLFALRSAEGEFTPAG